MQKTSLQMSSRYPIVVLAVVLLVLFVSAFTACAKGPRDLAYTKQVMSVVGDTCYKHLLTQIEYHNTHWHDKVRIPTLTEFQNEYVHLDSTIYDQLISAFLAFTTVKGYLSDRYSVIVAIDSLALSATLLVSDFAALNSDEQLESGFSPAFDFCCNRLRKMGKKPNPEVLDSVISRVISLLNEAPEKKVLLVTRYTDIPVDSVTTNTPHDPNKDQLQFLSRIAPPKHAESNGAIRSCFYVWTGSESVWSITTEVEHSFELKDITVEQIGKYGAGLNLY